MGTAHATAHHEASLTSVEQVKPVHVLRIRPAPRGPNAAAKCETLPRPFLSTFDRTLYSNARNPRTLYKRLFKRSDELIAVVVLGDSPDRDPDWRPICVPFEPPWLDERKAGATLSALVESSLEPTRGFFSIVPPTSSPRRIVSRIRPMLNALMDSLNVPLALMDLGAVGFVVGVCLFPYLLIRTVAKWLTSYSWLLVNGGCITRSFLHSATRMYTPRDSLLVVRRVWFGWYACIESESSSISQYLTNLECAALLAAWTSPIQKRLSVSELAEIFR